MQSPVKDGPILSEGSPEALRLVKSLVESVRVVSPPAEDLAAGYRVFLNRAAAEVLHAAMVASGWLP